MMYFQSKAPTQVMKIGVNDTFGESGPALELLKKYGLDTDSIYEKIKAFCKIISLHNLTKRTLRAFCFTEYLQSESTGAFF